MIVCIIVQSCGQQPPQEETNELIASKGGFSLTKTHFKSYLTFVEQQAGETSNLQAQLALRSELKKAFLKDPENVLKEVNGLNDAVGMSETNRALRSAASSAPKNISIGNNLAEGHTIVRQRLGNDIGEMNFDSEAANAFRSYMTNTLLTSRTNSSNNGYNSSDYSDSNARIQFCDNGTFTEALSGHLSINVAGMGALSSGTNYMPGYWEVAAMPNGMLVILMYSTHPRMLEDFPNGLLPFLVAKHTADFVALPGGAGYHRTANYYCN